MGRNRVALKATATYGEMNRCIHMLQAAPTLMQAIAESTCKGHIYAMKSIKTYFIELFYLFAVSFCPV